MDVYGLEDLFPSLRDWDEGKECIRRILVDEKPIINLVGNIYTNQFSSEQRWGGVVYFGNETNGRLRFGLSMSLRGSITTEKEALKLLEETVLQSQIENGVPYLHSIYSNRKLYREFPIIQYHSVQ